MPKRSEPVPCLKCDRPGFPTPVEKLPKGGTKWEVKHDDGQTCSWVQYPDISYILPKSKRVKKKQNPKYVICPECGEKGTLNVIPSKSKKNKAPYYRIIHQDQKIPGQFWNAKRPGRIRPKVPIHKLETQEQRDNLLKQIDLYIPKPGEKLRPEKKK